MRRDVWLEVRLRSVRTEGKREMERDGAFEIVVHASAVAIAGRAILILGGAGSGKSALALALTGRGADLVADDRVSLLRKGRALVVRPPAAIAGLVEARGLGILRLPAAPEAVAVLAVDLDRPHSARMPQRETIAYLGVELELISGGEIPDLDRTLTIFVQNGRAFSD
jgi:HPr kinase/phosphorylase